ncbi:C2 domain-containing protein 5-like isoform X2 [Paramacrobiotus metropolitanus]|uniref:C2 domain-containing protein 5-like isoform X2 n=1 Tax=Paramacrobiotus metropolitanus TaxID=2943436 RepID=UPI0024459470|nr:C2 domain-containing protein 5-like isoform X2 [Paramacrobiotus metropolitanus]
MPATVKVKICEARHLPVMDRSGETTDAFVEVRLANNIFKTDVCRRTLHPKWESEWFRFEVNDIELQEEPLQIRVMDYDTYSSHDAIGKIYVDLTNILMSENRTMFAGWLPIYDTLLGIRGELKIEIRLISFCVDMKSLRHFAQSILFFSSALFPSGFRIKRIIGLVDHSLVAEDPEHQWLDKIRTPRSTNEARQLLFMKMSGELRRKLGNKVADMGGNAVIALRQRIDLGHVGVIIRAIGTAAIVEKLAALSQLPSQDAETSIVGASSPGGPRKGSKLDTVTGSPEVSALTGIRQYDDLDQTVLPESNGGNQNPRFYLGGTLEHEQQQYPADLTRASLYAEFPFLTLKHIPAGVVKSIGGIVSCKMIKTLERLEQDDINQASYAQWWKEIRMEIFRHMKCIGCNAVYGYSEELCLTDEGNIQLLSAIGTAAILDIDLATKDRDCETVLETAWGMITRENFRKESSVLVYPEAMGQATDCKIYHIPSGEYADHVASTTSQCGVCKVGHVPEILLTTVEIPDGSPIKGMGTLVQARVQRKTKALKGESGARELSEIMPFIEYDLHSQISTKLKLLGCNAAFSLKMDLQCGSEVIIASATCTAACILSLPRPMRPTVLETDKGVESSDIQTKLDNTLEQYLRQLGLTDDKDDKTGKLTRPLRTTNVKKKKPGPRQFSKSGFVIDLENEKSEGRDVISLIDYLPSKDTLLMGSEICPMQDRLRQLRYTEFAQNSSAKPCGPFIQSFCRIWKTRVFGEQEDADDLLVSCQHLLRDVVFRARMFKPCRIAGIKFRFYLNPNDELLIMVQGSIVAEPLPLYSCLKGTGEGRRSLRHVSSRAGISGCEDNGDVMPLRTQTDEFSIADGNAKDTHAGLTTPRVGLVSLLRTRMSPPRPSQIFFQHQVTPQSLSGVSVDISSLSFVHSGTVKRYVGNLNIVVLRECQALRDNDGLSGFMQRTLADFYAVVRSQTVAAGGNAVLSFYIAQLQLADSYNQAQCIIHAYGDMVEIEDSVGTNASEA